MKYALPVTLACVALSCSKESPSVAPQTFTEYRPEGCSYAVKPPATRGFTNLRYHDDKRPDDIAAAAPVRVRLGTGGNTTHGSPGYPDLTQNRAFVWETRGVTNAAQVRLGLAPEALSDVHRGYSFTTPPPTSGIGTLDPAFEMHEVHVCGLKPGTTYYYQVGGEGAWSATQSFTTLPADGPITFGLSGDSRDSSDVFQLVQSRMRDAGVHFQLMSGDLVPWGAQGSAYRRFLDAAWKDPADGGKFLTLGQQLFLPIAGNHEGESAQFYGNFALPGEGDSAEAYFSFDVGNAHVLMFDDQGTALRPDADDAKAGVAWMDADLARANENRASHPILVVVEHRGILTTSEHAPDEDLIRARDALMPLWDKHHVDLVLSGHDHNYERSKPVTGPSSAPVVMATPTAGTTYVICAGAGAKPYAPGKGSEPYRELSVGYEDGSPFVGNYALVTLEARKLTFKAYGLKAAGGSVAGDEIIDSFELVGR